MEQRTTETALNWLAHLRGERLSLRLPLQEDAPAVFLYASDPAVTRFLAWPRHNSLADSECFLSRAIADRQGGKNLVWLIEDDSGVVGAIGARLSGVNAGVGYVLAQASWGRGYAGEALKLLCDALSTRSSVQALWAMCVAENVASARVLEKGGFHAERTLESYFSCPNGGDALCDVVVYTRSLGIPPRRKRSLPGRS